MGLRRGAHARPARNRQGAAKAAVRRGTGAAGGWHPRRSRHRRVPDDDPARAVRLGHPARGRGRACVGRAARHRPGPGGCPAAGTAPRARRLDPVASFADDVVAPSASLSVDGLAARPAKAAIRLPGCLTRSTTSASAPDADWADARTDGFTWWPYQQAQDISATLRGAEDVAQGVSIRIATEVRRGVPVTPRTLRTIAELNSELGQSVLVLRADGLLYLACRLYVHEGIDHWANEWAQEPGRRAVHRGARGFGEAR